MTNAPQAAAWPLARPIGLSVSVMLEGWEDTSAPGIGPMGNPLRAGVIDLQGRSWADYGPKAGAWRLLELLADLDVTAVFYTSGILIERYPDLMRAIHGAGHHVAGHAWAQNILPIYQMAEEEEYDVARCISAIEGVVGARPRGWISPRCTPSLMTSIILAREGFRWHADFFDSDVPDWAIDRDHGLVAMPFTMEVNDMPLYIRYGNEPRAYSETVRRFLAHWPQAATRPTCLDLTVHAHVFGRPYGLIELAESIAIAREHAALVEVTNHQILADQFIERSRHPAKAM